jgi:transcriptional regulator of acetoin/glycerol metabolism
MMDYHWPGNVRELQNAVHFALVKSKGRVIRPEDLPIELRHKENSPTPGPARKLDGDSVAAALKQSGGNKARAARLLGVGRATLYRFLEDSGV